MSQTACTNSASGLLWGACRAAHGYRGYIRSATLLVMECWLESVRSRERVTYVLFGGVSFDTATVPGAPRVEEAMLVRRIISVWKASVVLELPAKVHEAHAKTLGPCIRRRIVTETCVHLFTHFRFSYKRGTSRFCAFSSGDHER
jgi:hypothetical protein